MKLLRYGPPGAEKPGLLDSNGQIRDLSGIVNGYRRRSARARERSRNSPRSTPPNYLWCRRACGSALAWAAWASSSASGSNYSDHAAESNLPVPAEPVVFGKWTSAIVGPNDDIEIPRGSHEDRLGSRAWRRDRSMRALHRRSTTRCRMSRAIASSMTYRNANFSSSAAVPGTRARAATLSAPSAPGSSRGMRSPIRTRSGHVARSRRQAPPERQQRQHDLSHPAAHQLSERHDEPASRRRHFHRHARRGGPRAAAAGLPARRAIRCGWASTGWASSGNRCAPVPRPDYLRACRILKSRSPL